MASTDEFVSYASALANTSPDEGLQQRLGLYQVFLKLYDHRRELLDEILGLENSGSRALASVTLPYVQGVALAHQAHLVTNLLQGKTQALIQPQRTWIIGRDPRRVVIPIQDKRLSRFHAAIRYVENRGFYLVDLGSSNGSFVNGELVRQSSVLKDGDRIRLGSLSFIFFLCESAQVTESLSAETLAELKHRQPLLSASQERLNRQILDPSQELTEGNIPTLNLLDETYGFMRSS